MLQRDALKHTHNFPQEMITFLKIYDKNWSEILNEDITSYCIYKAWQVIKKTPTNAYLRYIMFKLFHSRIELNTSGNVYIK